MSEIAITISGIKNTVDSEGEAVESAVAVMKIGGSQIQKGKLKFKVKYTTTSIEVPDDDKIPVANGGDTGGDAPDTDAAKPLDFDIAIQRFSFVKQMYQPNEITMAVQIAPSADPEDKVVYHAVIDRETLKGAFCNQQVDMTIGGKSVGSDFYIHDIVPVYKQDAMYVTIHMFSPDKLLTMKSYSRTYVSKHLGAEIMEDVMPTFTVPYGDDTIGYDYADMKVLVDDKNNEHIFPYLVQYNESFYDFLARTTNRWGEFLYYEGGKLHIGFKDTATEVKEFDSYTFVDTRDTSDNVDSYNTEATYDPHVLENKLVKGGYDIVAAQLGCKTGWDVYLFKKLSQLLSFDTQIIDWAIGTLVDDTIALGVAEKISKDKNDTFNNNYFSSTKTSSEAAHYDSEKKNYNQFSEFSPIVKADTYLTILKGEVDAQRNIIQIDLDTNWQPLSLGDTIKFNNGSEVYECIIVKIEGFQEDRYKIQDNQTLIRITDNSNAPVIFRITAIIKSSDGSYYPTIIPAGHVRKSDMQIATVTDEDDPLRLNRVRVKYDWDDISSDSPWLVFATPIGVKSVGFQGRHHKGDKVMVSYHYGNIERPYVSGALPASIPRALYTNELVCNTPGGQAIKMSDGTGAEATNLLAGISPGVKFIQQFFPASDWFTSKDESGKSSDADKDVQSRYFEGSIEMGDKYGIWSIKGSTDSRNISIKSSWGDVNINAYTGITISAPNGDINIKGKNVNIEAGNNLTLTSGKNIKDKWYPTLYGADNWKQVLLSIGGIIAAAVIKKAEQLAMKLIDINVIRTLWETFVKPVEGKLEIKSNRYLMLEAGGAQASYPVDAYNKGKRVKVSKTSNELLTDFREIAPLVEESFNNLRTAYITLQALLDGVKATMRSATKNPDGNNPELPCRPINEILDDVWNGTQVDENLFGFTGMLGDPEANPDRTEEFLLFFDPGFAVAGIEALFNHDEYIAQSVETTKGLQNEIKVQLISQVKQMKLFMDGLKDKTFFTEVKNRKMKTDTVKDALSDGLLLQSPLHKLPKDGVNFKHFVMADNLLFTEADKKSLRRVFFKAVVTAWGIKQYSDVNKMTGKPATPVAAPDANTADDQTWNTWVDTLWTLPNPPKKDESALDKFEADLTKPLKKGIKCWEDLITNTADHFAFASEKKGAILYTSEPGTMVLGRDIYRANTDFSDDVHYANDAGAVNVEGVVTQVKELMKQ